MTQMEDVASNLVADDASPLPPIDLVPAERRVRIVLEESDLIPPTGQFFGVQGKGYYLRAGEEASVPVSIIGILNTAVMSVPVMDSGQRVIGYRDRLRFPYRVVTEQRPA